MIGISISDNSIGFMKCFKKTNLTHIEDFVMLQKKNPDITPANLNNIINRKKIRKSLYPSKKCKIFIDSSEVIMDLVNCPKEVDKNLFMNWYNNSIYGDTFPANLSQYNIEINNQSLLSMNIEKQKQYELYNLFKGNNLSLTSISISIFSADHLARSSFDADTSKGYLVWSVGKNKDEILVWKDGSFQCLFEMNRKNKKLSASRVLGSRKLCDEIISDFRNKIPNDLKTFKIVDKIFMYRRTIDSSIDKLYTKKNKEHITILNPLIKIDNLKLKKNKVVDSSFLANMGCMFDL
ncbi:MAG: hypothetical protein CMG59_00670 [Candidatus Marinimicrobia bacterium]|nr:hypothetical protein [Candidatus Neomarinimicrobiota bacterium]